MKIDTTKIAGFEEMTADEKLTALMDFEFPVEAPKAQVDTAEFERLKTALSKANGEAAEYKRQLRAKQTDDEVRAAEEAAARTEMEKELEKLRTEKAISAHKASYLSLGYDEETAEASARALHSGDYDTLFSNQKNFVEAQKKAAMTAAIDSQPGLSTGNPIGKQEIGDPFMAQVRKYAGLPNK